MRSAQQPQPGRRRVALRVNCGQLDPGRLALLSGRFDSTVGAVDDLRQPGTTGHGRHGATHVQSLRPTSEMRRFRRLRRRETPTRPNVGTKFGVSGGCPCVSYINWPANLSSAGAVRPPNEMAGPANKQPDAAVIAGTAAAQSPSIAAGSIGSRSRSKQRP
jgi:hypothetical protein